MQAFKFFGLLLITLCSATTVPAAGLDALAVGETARVTEVVDGDTVLLEREIDGARQVRLVGLQAPKLPLGRRGFKAWPLAADSKYALEALTLGKLVTLKFGGARMDRHGRHLAHLFRADGTWVQGQMLRRGMARVYTFADNRAVTEEMYGLEREARDANRGIWAHPFYAVRQATPDSLNNRIGTFQVIEGRVKDAAKVKRMIYLNFGDNWRDDFTATIDRKARRLFTKQQLDPVDLGGALIRVRGWLQKRNGPAIKISHPEQIEIITNPQ